MAESEEMTNLARQPAFSTKPAWIEELAATAFQRLPGAMSRGSVRVRKRLTVLWGASALAGGMLLAAAAISGASAGLRSVLLLAGGMVLLAAGAGGYSKNCSESAFEAVSAFLARLTPWIRNLSLTVGSLIQFLVLGVFLGQALVYGPDILVFPIHVGVMFAYALMGLLLLMLSYQFSPPLLSLCGSGRRTTKLPYGALWYGCVFFVAALGSVGLSATSHGGLVQGAVLLGFLGLVIARYEARKRSLLEARANLAERLGKVEALAGGVARGGSRAPSSSELLISCLGLQADMVESGGGWWPGIGSTLRADSTVHSAVDQFVHHLDRNGTVDSSMTSMWLHNRHCATDVRGSVADLQEFARFLRWQLI